MAAPGRPDVEDLLGAAGLLGKLAASHGLSNLRLGDEPGEVVVDVAAERTYFDIVAFEDEVEARLGWRPTVTSSGAPGARPGARLIPVLGRRVAGLASSGRARPPTGSLAALGGPSDTDPQQPALSEGGAAMRTEERF